jgi:hypothetical protein
MGYMSSPPERTEAMYKMPFYSLLKCAASKEITGLTKCKISFDIAGKKCRSMMLSKASSFVYPIRVEFPHLLQVWNNQLEVLHASFLVFHNFVIEGAISYHVWYIMLELFHQQS